jgi:hypothetical protein
MITDLDIFDLMKTPQGVAINRANEQAVEYWIVGNMKQANRFFDMAHTFFHASPEHFTPTSKETHAI